METKKCLYCKKEYSRGKIKLFDWNKRKYCSQECYYKSIKGRKNNKDNYNPNRKNKIKDKKICVVCGKEYKRHHRTTIPVWNNSKYCSLECMGISERKIKHPTSNLQLIIQRIRNCFKYRQWRSDIFTRDDFTCQECGKHGTYLEAHHIKSFSTIIDEYNIKTYEEALCCEELWDINNGTTLCLECHKKTDNYGNSK